MIYDVLLIAAIKLVGKKVKSVPIVLGEREGSSVPALISGFCSMMRLVFLLPLDWILVHRRLPPSILSDCPQTICWFPFVQLGGDKHCES